MADERHDDVDGGHVGDQLELLAADALEPDERDRALAHVETCPRCAAELAGLRRVVRQVLAAAPPVAPGPALTDRLVRAEAAARPPTRPPERSPWEPDEVPVVRGVDPAPTPVEHPRPRRRRLVAAAAAAILVVGVGVGVLVGRTTTDADGRPDALGRIGIDEVRTGRLLDATGAEVGTVVLTAGERATLVVDLDRVRAGVSYGCSVRLPGGGVVEVGRWAPASDDQTAWAVRVDAGAASAEEVVLNVPGGAVWATATVR